MMSNSAITNSVINLITQIFPVILALVMVPFFFSTYGEAAFASYALSVTLIVIFNYFNFGVAQSLVRELAGVLPNTSLFSRLLNSSFLLMLLASIVVSFVFLTAIGVYEGYSIDQGEEIATVEMLRVVAYSTPVFLMVILLRSVFESQQNFLVSSLNRSVLNSFIFLAPMFSWVMDFELVWALYLVVSVHFVSLLLLLKVVVEKYSNNYFDLLDWPALLRFATSGMWMTVISVSSVGLLYVDRYIGGAILGAATIASYVAVFDLVSRVSIFYGSVTAAFLPAFSKWSKERKYQKIVENYYYLLTLVSLVMLVICLFLAIYSDFILTIWISRDFSDAGAKILIVLSFGVFFNGLSSVPMRSLLAFGKLSKLAKFYFFQSSLFLILLVTYLPSEGMMFAAYAYAFRSLVEFIVFHLMLTRAVAIGFWSIPLLHVLGMALYLFVSSGVQGYTGLLMNTFVYLFTFVFSLKLVYKIFLKLKVASV